MFCRKVLQNIRFFFKWRPTRLMKNIVYFVTLCDKYTASWSKNACSKFPIYFSDFLFQVTVYLSQSVTKQSIFFQTTCGVPFRKKIDFVTLCDKYTVSWNKIHAFCSNLKCILSYVYIYRKFAISFVDFFVSTSSVFCQI